MTAKTILITGCSTGIGYVSAHGMKARGWQVFATARKAEDIDRLNAEGITTFYLDYTDEASIHACADQVLAETGGRLDVLFNNGAYGLLGAVEDIPTDALREQFEANFFGWHELTRRFIPVMREQGGGRIVQCSSVLGIVSGKHRAPYAATKHAIEAFATSMRIELEPFGIYTSSIRPGPINTMFMPNALAMLEAKIDLENTVHSQDYAASKKRLNSGAKSSVFKLEPEAVFRKLVHAAEAPIPKAAYSVTTLTYLVDAMRRLLPTRLLDGPLAKG
ncbi:MAG: SDR family NAD(P)-dependent oxidoreductase [Hyphomicrobiales bacterium]